MNPMLGLTVKDRVSGFQGIVTACGTHLGGPDRCFVEPSVSRDGKRMEGHWFDKVCLEVVAGERITLP